MADKSPNKSPKRLWPCPFDECSSVFKKRSHLLRHELIHNDKRPYECSFENCSKSFRTPCHLKRHKATHDGIKTFRCEYEGCEVACITEWNLKRHVKRTHLGAFKCETCNKEFKKNKLLQQHLSMEHKTSTVCCEFPGCGQIFSLPSKMKHHMKVHTEKGYVCSVKGCSMKFQLWSECRQHAVQCKQKEMKCDICGKVFTERSNFKAHEKVHHEEREVFQCSYAGCGRFYTKQYNLKIHIQSFHQNIRPFVCPKQYCSKSFHFQHLLRKHLESHCTSDAKPVKEVKKRKRSKRMITSTIAGITGYIPELWVKMTPEEMHAYVENDNSGCADDTDVYPHEVDTTQAEITPMTSSEFGVFSHSDCVKPQKISEERSELASIELQNSEETLTAITTDVDMSDEEERVILEPLKSLEDACLHLNRMNSLKRKHSNTSSSASSRPPSACSEEDAVRFAQLGDRIKHMAKPQKDINSGVANIREFPNVRDSCHLQSVTESDSSDTEMKSKVQQMMQRCAS